MLRRRWVLWPKSSLKTCVSVARNTAVAMAGACQGWFHFLMLMPISVTWLQGIGLLGLWPKLPNLEVSNKNCVLFEEDRLICQKVDSDLVSGCVWEARVVQSLVIFFELSLPHRLVH